jgi:TolB-like protein/class 3 adenylate cyclase
MERRLAAIVCADVAGYSRMMGADEEGTYATFKAHRNAIYPVILNHGGRLVKNTGDGFLLEYPSVVGALQSSIEIQTLMAERNARLPADRLMQFRLGVHMGDVMADEDEVFGDGVNIAVRLESMATPGGVAVSGKAYKEASKHIHVPLVDAGSRRLKNIEEAINVWTWDPGGSETRSLDPHNKSNLPAQYRTAIVGVLPFVNLSDRAEEYFSDGLTEDLIHALSLQSFFRVLSRNATFSFKGQNLSTRLIAREIDATYLIQGSVRRAGNKIRVTAQLIAPESGEQLWASRCDSDIGDLFAMQDELTTNLSAAIAPEIFRAEASAPARSARRERSASLERASRKRSAPSRPVVARWRSRSISTRSKLSCKPCCRPCSIAITALLSASGISLRNNASAALAPAFANNCRKSRRSWKTASSADAAAASPVEA